MDVRPAPAAACPAPGLLPIENKQYPGAYGIDGRVWFVEREANKLGRLDPATGRIDEFPTPGGDVPRRMGTDWEGISGSASMRPASS